MSTTTTGRDRTLAGLHRWGRYEVRPVSRTMWSGRTLVVFAPGTSAGERLLLRAWHVWPLVGAVAALVVMAAVGHPSGIGLAAAVVVYVIGFVVLARATRTLRPHVRCLTVTTFHGNGRPEVHGDVELLEVSLETLRCLGRAERAGQVDPVDAEVVWATVWNALPAR